MTGPTARLFLACLSGLALSACASELATGTSAEGASADSLSRCGLDSESSGFLRAINTARIAEGLAPLRCDEELTEATQAHVDAMCGEGWFGLTDPGGGHAPAVDPVGHASGALRTGVSRTSPRDMHAGLGAGPDRSFLLEDEIAIGISYRRCRGQDEEGPRPADEPEAGRDRRFVSSLVHRWSFVTRRVVASTPTGACANPETQEVMEQANDARRREGRAPLTCDSALTEIAAAHAQDMCDRGYFSHVSPDGQTFQDRLGAGYPVAAENLYRAADSARAVDAWLGSAGHRANLLGDPFTVSGVGVVRCGPGTVNVVAIYAGGPHDGSVDETDPPATDERCGDLGAESAEMIRLHVEHRESLGLPTLSCHDALRRAAQRHAEDMCDRDFFSHVSPDGVGYAQRVMDEGVTLASGGENLAMHFSAQEAFEAWLESPGHRANIEADTYDSIGVGIAPCGDTTRFVVAMGAE